MVEFGYQGVDVVKLWHALGKGAKEIGLEMLDPLGAEILETFTNWSTKDAMSLQKAYLIVQAQAQHQRQLIVDDAAMQQPPSPENKRGVVDEFRLFRIFQKFDTDRDGYIGRDGVRLMMKDLCGKTLGDQELDGMMFAMDHNKDGKVDFREFATFILNPT